MAVDAYMYFRDYSGDYLPSESQVDAANAKEPLWKKYEFDKALNGAAGGGSGLFEVEDFSFDIEQVLSIGSQSSGAGAGKVTFNPFSITRKIDRSSPTFFKMSCAGESFQTVTLGARKSQGGNAAGGVYLVFQFKLVAVKTLSWSYDDEAPKETITFEYGGLLIEYSLQLPSGQFDSKPYQQGWNRVRNIADAAPNQKI